MSLPKPGRIQQPPTDLQKMRFDYAWKWFSFHAEQRTKMFNYMIIGLGVLAGAVVSAINDGLEREASIICLFAILLGAAFFLLDKRNRRLYSVAQDVLIDAERTYLFGRDVWYEVANGKSAIFGIAQRTQPRQRDTGDTGDKLDFSPDPNKEFPDLPGWRPEIARGSHKWWMPLVIAILMSLFLAVGLICAFHWIKYGNSHDQLRQAAPCCCTVHADGTTCSTSGGATQSGGPNARVEPLSSEVTATVLPAYRDIDRDIDLNRDFNPNEVSDRSTLFWFEIGGGLALMAIGAVALYRGKKVAGSVTMMLGAAATALLPHLTVPVNFNSKFEAKLADKIEAKLAEKIEGKLNFEKRTGEPGPLRANMLSSAKFGGFGQGIESFNCADKVNEAKIAQINNAIHGAQKQQLRPVIFLIGSTDRKPLSRELRERFESNSGLARARVEAVERCLDIGIVLGSPPPPNAPEVVPLVTGPSYVPNVRDSDGVMSQMMAEDRSVKVFIIAFPVIDKPASE